MQDYNCDLWRLTELRQDDPRSYLEVIVFNAKFDRVQTIEYQKEKVFVISEKQYQKLLKCT